MLLKSDIEGREMFLRMAIRKAIDMSIPDKDDVRLAADGLKTGRLREAGIAALQAVLDSVHEQACRARDEDSHSLEWQVHSLGVVTRKDHAYEAALGAAAYMETYARYYATANYLASAIISYATNRRGA